MSTSTEFPAENNAHFIRNAYEHCARIAIGMLTSKGSLSPQLFFVGHPLTENDPATSKIALAGAQAMHAFHASSEGADQLIPFIRQALAPDSKPGLALQKQIGRAQLAVHACHALVDSDIGMQYPPGCEALKHADGKKECILVTVHTSSHSQIAYCPVYRNSQGALECKIAELQSPSTN
jgi:hypothetical protein